MPTQINKLIETNLIESIIEHHQQNAALTPYQRYGLAKNELWQAQRHGDYPGDGAAYEAAIQRFVDAFGV